MTDYHTMADNGRMLPKQRYIRPHGNRDTTSILGIFRYHGEIAVAKKVIDSVLSAKMHESVAKGKYI